MSTILSNLSFDGRILLLSIVSVLIFAYAIHSMVTRKAIGHIVGFLFLAVSMTAFAVKEAFFPKQPSITLTVFSAVFGVLGVVIALYSGYQKKKQCEEQINPVLIRGALIGFVIAGIGFLVAIIALFLK